MKSMTETSKESFYVTMIVSSLATDIRIINHKMSSLVFYSIFHNSLTPMKKHNLRTIENSEVRLMRIQ